MRSKKEDCFVGTSRRFKRFKTVKCLSRLFKFERIRKFYWQGGNVNYFSGLSNSQEIERIFLDSPIWQLRINEEGVRIIGILEKGDGKFLANDKKHNKDLFYILYYDFHHTSFSNPNKEKPKEEDLICIMNEKCPSYIFFPIEDK
jgi:hypothetical protein